MTYANQRDRLVEEHHLAARLIRCAEQAGSCLVLVSSAHSGEGKTHLLEVLARCAAQVSTQRIAVGSADQLLPQLKRAELDADLWFMEVPALLDSTAVADLDPEIWKTVDGAVIVALGHVTTRADLRACQERLSALGVKPLGVVWNEKDHPNLQDAWRELKRRTLQMFQLRRPGAAVHVEKAG